MLARRPYPLIFLCFWKYRYLTPSFDRPGFNQLIADATAGKINLVLCKDLSRLGRDYIESGKYTDIVFPSLGCRFIALNDGVDTAHKNNEMLVILKNVMNDLYARDTSAKIRAVKRSSFQAGKYVGCYAPIGYLKSPDDKHILIPDPATAPLVRRIFDMRCQGLSYRKIATTLNEEKVSTPRDLYYLQKGMVNPRQDGGYWQAQTVKAILRNEVYIGHTVQNKTGNISYKVHKQVGKPEAEWIRVEGTHEPLISMEVWELVRTIEQQNARSRTQANGETALFAGLLYCMDCGSTMRHHGDYHKCKDGTPVRSTYESYLCNRYCCGGKDICTAHTMNQKVLIQVVLTDIRMKAKQARNDPARLIEQIQTQRRASSAEQQRAHLSGELEAYQQETDDVQQWMSLIRECAKLEELDRPTLLRLVQRIDIGERKVEDGREIRDIRIHYNFVGYIEA